MSDELQALNHEKRQKVEELVRLAGDLQNLMVATDVATLFLDEQLKIVRFTPKLAELLNVRPADEGRHISEFTHRLGYSDFTNDAEAVLTRREHVEREVQDETGRWYLTRVLPYRTPDDRVDGVVVNFIDISDLKRMEEGLRSAESFAENIFDTIRVPLLVLSPELSVVNANPAFYEHFKVKSEDTVGRPIFELGDSGWDVPELRGLLDEVPPARKSFEDIEIEHEFEDIGWRTILINVRQLDDLQLVLLSIRDITEQRIGELELRAAKESAEAADKAKGQFLSTMSHELRTPLNAVLGFAELLELEVVGPINAKQRDYLERIERSTLRLVEMVSEILTLSRSEAGEERLTMSRADLADIVRNELALLEASTDVPGVDLSLAGAEETIMVTTDTAKVRQIIGNLLGNAVKYADGSVELELEANQRWVNVRVRDQGPGIPSDQFDRIFEPFVQLDSSTSRVRGGTGLGLAIARRFARLLGGDVTVDSTVGEGSLFTLRLPRD